jgi:hypothetical protein
LQLSPTEESAVRALDAAYVQAINAQQEQPQQEQSDAALADTFLAADEVLAAMANPHPRLLNLRVQSARVLAADAQILPGTAVGDRVVEILLGAANDENEGHFLE